MKDQETKSCKKTETDRDVLGDGEVNQTTTEKSQMMKAQKPMREAKQEVRSQAAETSTAKAPGSSVETVEALGAGYPCGGGESSRPMVLSPGSANEHQDHQQASNGNSRKSLKEGSTLNTALDTLKTGSVHGGSESRWSMALRSCSADERQGHHQINMRQQAAADAECKKERNMKNLISTGLKASAMNIVVEEKSGMSNTRPRLIAGEPVDKGNGTWDIHIDYNAACGQEFAKLTNQAPTPEKIKLWVMNTMDTDPIKLKKYLMEQEDYEASAYYAQDIASLKG